MRIELVDASGGNIAEVHTVSSAAAIRASAMLRQLVVSDHPAEGRAQDESPVSDDAVVFSVSIEHVPAGALVRVVRFMEASLDASPRRCKPVHATPCTGGRGELMVALLSSNAEQEVVSPVMGDPDRLVELTLAADFLQVARLLDLCCACIAETVLRRLQSDGEVLPGVARLPQLVLVAVLSHLGWEEQTRLLERDVVFREAACVYGFRNWIADLSGCGGGGDGAAMGPATYRSWLMLPRSILQHVPATSDGDGVAVEQQYDDVDDAMSRVGSVAEVFMAQHGFVPAAVTRDDVVAALDALLVIVGPIAVGIFCDAAAGPLSSGWLQSALLRFGLGHWIAPAQILEEAQLEILQPATLVVRTVTADDDATMAVPLSFLIAALARHRDESREAVERVPTPCRLALSLTKEYSQVIVADHIVADPTSHRVYCWSVNMRDAGRVMLTCCSSVDGKKKLTCGTPFDTIGATPTCGVVTLPDSTFAYRGTLKRIDLSNCFAMKSIGNWFGFTSGVTAVDLGGWRAVTVGDCFLADCRRLATVVASAPCLVETFGNSAFTGCVALTHIDLSQCFSLRSVGVNFCKSTGVTALDLGGWTVTDVGARFFAHCDHLTSVTCSRSSSVRSFADDAFSNCTALRSVELAACGDLRIIGGAFGYHAGEVVLDLGGWQARDIGPNFFAGSLLQSVTASSPCSIERFGECAFYRCSLLETIDLRNCDALVTIGDDFGGLSGVSELDLGGWPTVTLGSGFFSHCEGLRSVACTGACGIASFPEGSFAHSGIRFVDAAHCPVLLAALAPIISGRR